MAADRFEERRLVKKSLTTIVLCSSTDASSKILPNGHLPSAEVGKAKPQSYYARGWPPTNWNSNHADTSYRPAPMLCRTRETMTVMSTVAPQSVSQSTSPARFDAKNGSAPMSYRPAPMLSRKSETVHTTNTVTPQRVTQMNVASLAHTRADTKNVPAPMLCRTGELEIKKSVVTPQRVYLTKVPSATEIFTSSTHSVSQRTPLMNDSVSQRISNDPRRTKTRWYTPPTLDNMPKKPSQPYTPKNTPPYSKPPSYAPLKFPLSSNGTRFGPPRTKRTLSDDANQNYYDSKGCRSRCSSLGERGSGLRPRGAVQDFEQLRQECLAGGYLFEDPEFPAEDSSLFFSQTPRKPFEWKRPFEICDDPRLFVEGFSRFDAQQGELGDCWLIAAVANLTLDKRLFHQIVPEDQSFVDQYAGIFHFRFWQYGRWVDVVIDDRLPTIHGQLAFLHSNEKNEFWSALLEKAYAKLHGSYEALKGGTTCEAMEDFTGGVTEMYELEKAPSNLFKIMLKAYERSSLMGCSLEPDPNVVEAQTSEGLVRGHAYSITRVCYVDITTPNSTGKIPLIRMRNPWGNEAEWNGAWSDKSPEWRFISDSEKEEIGLTFEHDGEFWMSYRDFLSRFSRLEICNLNPDSLESEEDDSGRKKWEMSHYEGEWVRGVTAGGCRNNLETFWHNPQYIITLEDPDEDDDESKCTVIVALMQKNRRAQRRMGAECLTIGFAIYHLEDPENLPKPLGLEFFKYNASVARSPSFINLREVSSRFKLPPGTYCIVPSTFDSNEEGEFILRVFSENKNHMEEHDEEVGMGEVDSRIKEADPQPEDKSRDDKVKEFFRKIAGDDLEVDWMELKEILDFAMKNETKGEGFSKDVCRSMVAMMDVDRSGKLGFEEFKALWIDIRNWKGVFKLYDKDNSGCLSAFELRQALNSAGYRLNNHILNMLVHRYARRDGKISFDDFMMCAVRLKGMIDTFKERDPDNTNSATFTLEEWVEKTVYS
ncbi:calpain-A-like isoform X4 [Ischnura elegans]|uniref:calpain-A-like isoform X4 n=1 Tax=Ischnura elegans TaxID=197161 RepID=UPI001ED8B2BB|nr:calpain-A-like isoform X4 [Ischnura elegans]